jgi:hypothetical protein
MSIHGHQNESTDASRLGAVVLGAAAGHGADGLVAAAGLGLGAAGHGLGAASHGHVGILFIYVMWEDYLSMLCAQIVADM